MTERKPPGMSSGSWAEAQIQAAMRRGELDDLPGAGKPLADLGKPYDPDWWLKSLVQREQISLLPPALQARKLREALLESLGALTDEHAVRAAVAELNTALAQLNSRVTEGPATSVALLDVEVTLRRWREQRGAGEDGDRPGAV